MDPTWLFARNRRLQQLRDKKGKKTLGTALLNLAELKAANVFPVTRTLVLDITSTKVPDIVAITALPGMALTWASPRVSMSTPVAR